MKVRAVFNDEPRLKECVVTIEPSWFARVILRRHTVDRLVVCVPDINGGEAWIWDMTSQRIEDRRVIVAICAARMRHITTTSNRLMRARLVSIASRR